ncbi:MAG TPA: N-acetylmuramoyl-L-alanine amidase [Elusimicrobiota bacterium]|nr:N-acetylmuramoyl-L-alanine amidase [Elusimicrobiota bacterium]
MKGGKVLGDSEAYQVGDAWYLGAKDAAKVYGAGLYWHPRKGEVRLSFRGTPIAFTVDSDKARLRDGEIALDHPVLLRADRAFIPLTFFLSPEFSSLSSLESTFDPSARLLRVEPRATVGPVRYSSEPARTRVVLELEPGLGYSTDRRGRSGLEISVGGGSIGAARRVDIGDAAVDYVELRPAGRGASLYLALRDGVSEWKVTELDSPRRVVIDLAPPAHPALPDAERVRAEAPTPPAPAPAAEPAKPGAPNGGNALSRDAAPPPPAAAADAPSPKKQALANVRRRIVVDAGHGGKDSGAPGVGGLSEKDVNLAAAKDLAAALRKEGFEVLLTRDRDVFVPLGDRSKKANEFGADLFVSLHCNAHNNKAENGFEIYFLSEHASDPEAQRLAEFENSVRKLEDSVEDEATTLLYALARTEFINDSSEVSGLMAHSLSKKVDLANRGVKQASFYVLRGTNSPAVLVEMGFVTNRKDASKLRSASYRKKLVDGLRAGLLAFAKRKDWKVRAK